MNKPERREGGTPTTLTFVCSDGNFHFVVEDIERIVLTIAGAIIAMRGDYEVRLCL